MTSHEARPYERVLLVDDEPQVLVALEDLLSDKFVVIAANSAERALDVIEETPNIAVVITDQRMPRMTGDELLARLEGQTGATRVLLTGFADLSAVIRAVNEGRIFAYVSKPWDPGDLKLKVQRAAEHFRMTQELDEERRFMRDLMENTPDGVYFKDAELRFLRANQPLLTRLGVGRDAVLGKRLSDVVGTDDATRAAEGEEQQLLQDGGTLVDVVRKYSNAGVERWFSESKAPVRNAANHVVGMVGISRDVSQRVAHEARIARLTSIQMLISGINSAIAHATDADELLAASCRIAVTADELALAVVARIEPTSKHVRFVAMEPAEAPVVRELAVILDGGPHRSPLLDNLAKTLEPAVINDIAGASFLAYRDLMLSHGLGSAAVLPLLVDGKLDAVWCLFGTKAGFFDSEEVKLFVDVTQNLSSALTHLRDASRLRFLHRHDALTRLPNRDRFLELVVQRIGERQRDRQQLAVVVVDIGRFRQINETLGRESGDALLAQIGERLDRAARGRADVARLFGNTFAVLIPEVEDESAAGAYVETTILRSLRGAFTITDTEVLTAARAGIALYPADGGTGEQLLANAEAALKRAKATGQAHVFYSPTMNARVAEQLALEIKLRRAIEREEFLLHYQPKVDFKTGVVVGVEALIRWRDPEAGLVPPGRFIPLLEETGLIGEVGQWVLEQAVAQREAWSRAGAAPCRVAINVSALQLAAPDFLTRLERVTRSSEAAAREIDLEITESVFLEDLSGSIAKLEHARALGYRIALDDFGTGYSCLSALGKLPLDSMKIDRSFVGRMTEDSQSTAIVTTIISLAKALDLTIVAEGVETAEQARLLRLLHCHQGQGYLFAKPAPPEDVVACLGKPLAGSSDPGSSSR